MFKQHRINYTTLITTSTWNLEKYLLTTLYNRKANSVVHSRRRYLEAVLPSRKSVIAMDGVNRRVGDGLGNARLPSLILPDFESHSLILHHYILLRATGGVRKLFEGLEVSV